LQGDHCDLEVVPGGEEHLGGGISSSLLAIGQHHHPSRQVPGKECGGQSQAPSDVGLVWYRNGLDPGKLQGIARLDLHQGVRSEDHHPCDVVPALVLKRRMHVFQRLRLPLRPHRGRSVHHEHHPEGVHRFLPGQSGQGEHQQEEQQEAEARGDDAASTPDLPPGPHRQPDDGEGQQQEPQILRPLHAQ